jgi:SPP1 family predicted phage head-tail adaptor
MYNEVITLLSIELEQNDKGDLVEKAVEETNVYAQVKSVGMKESYEAMAVGLKAEYVFVIADYYDYNDQTHVSYKNKRWKILRTYRKDNRMDIVVTR